MRVLQAMLTGMHWFPNVPGGLNRYFHGLIHALPEADVCGHAFVTSMKPGQSGPLNLRGFSQPNDSIARQLLGVRRAARSAIADGTEVANSHFAKFAYPWLSLLPSYMPLVVHFHGPWADEMALEGHGLAQRCPIWMARHMERAVYNRATLCITLSRAFRDLLHERFYVPNERIRVIPGGIDAEFWVQAPDRSEARRRLGWPQDRTIFVSIRRHMKRMGLENLVDAFHILSKSHPEALLMIGGTGPLSDALDARIEQLGLETTVRRLGLVPDEHLPTLYAAADCSVVPSVALEGFGLATLESLAAGTPVVGTAIGGTTEILLPLAPQLLFAAPAPDAIAAHLALILEKRLDLPDRTACRRYARQFGKREVAMRVRSVYDEALTR